MGERRGGGGAAAARAWKRGEPGSRASRASRANERCTSAAVLLREHPRGREDRALYGALYGRIVSRLRRCGASGRCSRSTWRPPPSWAGAGKRLLGVTGSSRSRTWLGCSRHVLVAEVTQPSLGVGYEQDQAVALNKRILCLFRPQSGRVLSAMIRGAADGSRFQVLGL
uniref:2'-deoxynucleoside 5'-phosphate N-hydrolase 1-like n=1 Tax=Nyctereutes procyonoides TaxID=34880 RepID=UPI002443E281|nr:2'-deoxynucleoside 5'-phosphate N-hydrolase 1-like [Nyctereutes procyonoides]